MDGSSINREARLAGARRDAGSRGITTRWTCRRVCTRNAAAAAAPAVRRRSRRSSRGCAGDRSARRAAGDRRRSPAAPAGRSSTYFGATGGGLWKTTDGGLTWRPVSDSFFKIVVGRRGRRLRVEPGRRLRRHGRDRAARQHPPGRRRLQIDRRRQDLDARRPREDAGDRRASASTRPIPTSSTSRRSAIPTAPTRSAASSRSTDGGKTLDEGRCSATTRPARSISSMDPKNPDVLYAGLWEVFRTPHSLSSGGPGSGLFKTTDGGEHWTELTKNAGLPKPIWGKVGVAVSAPTATASTRSSKRPTAASSCPTTPARRGSWSTTTAGCASARSTTPHLRRPAGARTRSTFSTPASTARPTPARSLRAHPRAARRQPRPVDRAERSEADDQQQRRRRQRLDQRRRDLDRPGLPDRAVLQRLHDGARAVSRLRRAAGQQHRLRAEHRRRRALRGRRRRERLHRAGPAGHATCSTPAATAGC